MSEEILVDVNAFETRVALVVDGALREIHVERPDALSLRGNLYRGKVARVVPGVQAAFVNIGIARPGFLHVRDMHGFRVDASQATPDISTLVRRGQRLLVQVSKDPLNGKGVRLTTNLALAARALVLLPFDTHIGVSVRIVDDAERARLKALIETIRDELGQPYGYIARTACETATEDQIRAEIESLARLWQRVWRRFGELGGAGAADGNDCRTGEDSLVFEELPVPSRIVRDLARPATGAIVVNHPASFDRIAAYVADCLPGFTGQVIGHEGRTPLFESRGLEAAIEMALDKRLPLPSGGCLVIEQTEAMTTIDVNSGAFVDAADLESTAFTTNREAAREIPGQLRLRNIGGIVVVDFIDMVEDEHRRAVMDTLLDAAADDPARFRASGFSQLGLVEISRRRTRESLVRQLCEPCGSCSGRAFAKSPQSTCYDILRAVKKQASDPPGGVTEYLLRASQQVIDRLLDEDAPYLADLAREIERPIRLQVEPAYAADQFDLVLH